MVAALFVTAAALTHSPPRLPKAAAEAYRQLERDVQLVPGAMDKAEARAKALLPLWDGPAGAEAEAAGRRAGLHADALRGLAGFEHKLEGFSWRLAGHMAWQKARAEGRVGRGREGGQRGLARSHLSAPPALTHALSPASLSLSAPQAGPKAR